MTSPVALDSRHITRLEYQGREILILGTAHVSSASVDEVRALIRSVRPKTVCVELDEMRYQALTDDSRWRKLDIFQVIRDKKLLFLLVNLTLTAYQRRIGDRLGVRPGAELIAAVEEAKAVGAQLVLADRDIQATLKRSFASISWWNRVQLIGSLITGFFASNEISEEEIEKLKDRDTISEVMTEFARVMPALQIPLIDERDRYLMSSVQEAPGTPIVAVVGAGHVAGMTRYLGQAVDRASLCSIPQPKLLARSLKWLIPTIVLLAFFWGYRQHQAQGLSEMLYRWILPNSVMAAIFSILAGARPLTVLTASIASPITSLNPTIGAGMVAAFVEAWLRRPTVADCEQVPTAMLTIKGAYGNPFTRVLIVGVGATIGSALGAYVGAAWIAQWFLS